MAWSWSHTNEAYRNAYLNTHDLPHACLVEIEAEWEAWDGDTFAPNIDCNKFDTIIANGELAACSSDILADGIWDKAFELSTCDDGGFDAWLCPFGCDKHKVSFDRDPIVTEQQSDIMAPERAQELLDHRTAVTSPTGISFAGRTIEIGDIRKHMSAEEIKFATDVWHTRPGSASFYTTLVYIARGMTD